MAKTYAEWLPSSDYEVINAPHFSFTKIDEHKKDYAYSEVWIPFEKNKITESNVRCVIYLQLFLKMKNRNILRQNHL